MTDIDARLFGKVEAPENTPLNVLANTHLGIDAHYYLKRLTDNPPSREPLLAATGGLPLALTQRIEAVLRTLEKLRIKPVFVLPGLLPAKRWKQPQHHGEWEGGCKARRGAWAKYEPCWHLYNRSLPCFRNDPFRLCLSSLCLHRIAQSLSMEIDLFRTLAVHSQWHPDLIAAAISTKNTLQVEQYLATLEDGATRLQRIEDRDESPSNLADIDTDQDDSDLDLNVEPAYQVSEAWIAAQEALAAYVIEEENTALLEHYRGTASDRKKAREKHPLGRPRINDGCKGRCPRYRCCGARRLTPDEEEDSPTLKHPRDASPGWRPSSRIQNNPVQNDHVSSLHAMTTCPTWTMHI